MDNFVHEQFVGERGLPQDAADELIDEQGGGCAPWSTTRLVAAPARAPTEDSIACYLNEIGHVPLLSAAEELDLARQMERGSHAAQQLAAVTGLSRSLRAQLEADVASGQEAQMRLVQANLRLVVNIAKRYVGYGLPLPDLIQEGNLGLMRAAEKFDYHKGYRFATYATWWVRQAVIRAIAVHGRTIRLPVHLSEIAGKIRRTSEQLAQALGRHPTTAELADALGRSVAQIERALAAMHPPISLATPVGEDDQTLGDVVVGEAQCSPNEVAAQHLLHQELTALLRHLTERERQIIDLRFGLTDGQSRTLEEIGQVMGLTRERVRQIEVAVLRRLRDLGAGRHLREFLE